MLFLWCPGVLHRGQPSAALRGAAASERSVPKCGARGAEGAAHGHLTPAVCGAGPRGAKPLRLPVGDQVSGATACTRLVLIVILRCVNNKRLMMTLLFIRLMSVGLHLQMTRSGKYYIYIVQEVSLTI